MTTTKIDTRKLDMIFFIAFETNTNLTYEQIENLTIRKFTSLLRVADAKLSYLAYKIGEMSGLVTFKTPFPHWIYTKENARQSLLDNIMTFDQVQKKIGEGGVTE